MAGLPPCEQLLQGNMSRHYVFDAIFKGIRAAGSGAPYFRGNVGGQQAGEMGGLYVGQQKAKMGPRGGKIKKLSPTTGKPIYYKKWQSGSGAIAPNLAKPTTGGGPPDGYQVYQDHSQHSIGKTGSGKDIHSRPNINGTKHYAWDDHRDASQAHFALTHYLMNMIRDGKNKGKKTEGLERLMHSHAQFALHHKKEAVKDMLHGKQRSMSKEDLSDREASKG